MFCSLVGDNKNSMKKDTIQLFIFLKLAVSGHMTIFLARTRGFFWSIRPSGLLFSAAILTKIAATLIVVFGVFVTPLAWQFAVFIWIYAFVAFVITDLLKLRFCKLLDHTGIIFHR